PDGIAEKVYGYTSRFVPTDWKPRYNLNPREGIPVVYFDPVLRQKALRVMHWNLIPSKLGSREDVDAFDARYSCFNARIESVASTPTFRDPWRSQRCLVLVDGMIEWVGEKGNKIPHLLRRPDAAPFALAGLWSRWQGADEGEDLWSCAVVVCGASKWYSRFHDRMALVASPKIFDEWLDPDRKDGQLELLKREPYPMSKELEYFPISRLVNNPGYDAPDCLIPAAVG
ncbi:MAG: SOS response-associated peptidase, partial [Gemmatimonadota bacterium]|nr:SOS response-associated peptidase [Gemmatimonadota bacterium]